MVDDEGMSANVDGETASATEAANVIARRHSILIDASRKQGLGA